VPDAGDDPTASADPVAPEESTTPLPTATRTATLDAGQRPGQQEPSPSPTTASPTPGSPAPAEPSEPSWTPPADTTPPETSLSQDEEDRDTAVFSFSADEAASFLCSIDGGSWTSCTSPTSYSDLGSGWHTFAVVATDAAGNVDPTPAQTSWHVKGGGKPD
jgi:hypothetical protein